MGQYLSIRTDFFISLPKISEGNTRVVVFVDRLSRIAHLAVVPDKGTAKLFIDRVLRQHGLPVAIVSDRYSLSTGTYWKLIFRVLGTRLDMSTADHPQTDGQTERVNRIIEDILRSVYLSAGAQCSRLLSLR